MAEVSEYLRKFLADCEREFSTRYTDEDPEFINYRKSTQRGPPLEEKWFGRQPRQFDRSDRGRSDRNDQGRRDDRRGGGRDGRDRGDSYRGPDRHRDQHQSRHHPYGHHSDRPRYR